MTTTQRSRPPRPSQPAPNPASRGLILVAVAVVLGVILLVKGGGVGFEQDSEELEIASGGGAPAEESVTTTTEAGPATSVPPASLTIVALNGAGLDGYAGRAQQFLSVAGYTSTTAATAATPSPTTTVYFAPGFEADAFTVAALFQLEAGAVQPLPVDASLARDPTELPATTNVAIVLGADVQNIVDGAAANATTTTAAG